MKHQKTILQNTFHYCEPNECFNKFRLVCKSWQDAVETIRFDRIVAIDDWILDYEQNGNFQTFLPKFLKIFKKLHLNITSQISMKFDSVTKLILQNMKNLHAVKFDLEDNIPQNFDAFALQFLQNSQSTLKTLEFNTREIFPLPIISLPSVTQIFFQVNVDHNEQIEQFTNFVQRILENCEYLENFYIDNIHNSIQITEYIAKNYPENCLYTNYCYASQKLPIKMSSCPRLSSLPTLEYPSAMKCLYLKVIDFNRPYDERWEEYKSILALCPNLKKIRIVQCIEDNQIELEEALQNISPANQDIWKERIQYLKLCGIDTINWDQFQNAMKQLREQSKWGFLFHKK